MPLVLDVLTHLDERSMAETSRQLKSHFEEGGHESGEKFGSNLLEGVMAGFHGGDFESIGGIFESAGIAAKATRSGEAVGAAFAAGITVAAGAALVDLGVKVGETFEGINRQIELHTAASGKALEDLKAHADALVGSLDSSTASLGNDMATLATRLQMGPGAALDQLTQHVEMLQDRFGNFNVGALAGAFRNLGVDGSQADNVLASLVETTRRSSASMADMVNNLAGSSPTFAQLHMNAEQSAAVLGEMEKNSVPAARGMTALEAAMKGAAAQHEDLATFLDRATRGIKEYVAAGDNASAQAMSESIFGTRKWTEGTQAAQAWLDVVRQGPDAFKGNDKQLDDLAKQTRNLHNEWEEVQNKVKAALAPVALNVVDDVSQKMDVFIGWLNAHQEDLKNFFEGSIHVVGEVVSGVGQLAALLGRHPALIQAVAVAFGTWEAIKGVSFVLTGLEAVGAWLVAAPAEAATAGTAMEAMGAQGAAGGAEAAAGLAPVTAELAAIPAEAETAGTALTAAGAAGDAAFLGFAATLGTVVADLILVGATAASVLTTAGDARGAKANPDNMSKGKATKAYSDSHGGHDGAEVWPKGTEEWLGGKGPMPAELQPFYHPPAGTTGAPPPKPGTGAFAPQNSPDVGPRAGTDLPGRSVSPGTPESPNPELPPLTLADLDPKKGGKGPRLPEAPQVPYGAGYGAAPRPGETAEQYGAEQKVLEDRHAVAEAQARLTQLEHDNNAKADDITKARNDLLKAQGEQNSAELRLYQEQTKQVGKHTADMGTLGAAIDKDFGISKGLSGIADNLTKFLANLALAPVLGGLANTVEASGVKQSAPGAGGLMGLAAVSGMFGPQFMAGGAGATGGMPQGPFGGYPGVKGAPGAGSVGGGFAGIAMPAGDKMTYGTSALASLGLSPLAQNPSGGGNPVIPEWVQDFVHEHGGPGLSAGSSPHGSLHGNPGGPDYAVDVTGDKSQQDRLAEFLQAHPELSAMMIHQSQISGEDYGIAGGQNVPKGTYFTTPGGTYADEGPMVHWAPSIRPGGGQGPLQGPGAIPGPSMSTDASGAVTGAPSAYRPRGTDTIPAMLSPGEEVEQTSAVQKYGAGTFNAMNKGLVDPTSIRYLDAGSDGALEPGQQGGSTQIGGGAANAGSGAGIPGGGGAGAAAGADAIGGAAAPKGVGGGMSAVGGGAAAGAAAGAASMGIGLAAQIAMQEAQRAIQYGGAVAGIAGEGLMETFLPTGASQLAQNSWLTKIAGGLMGAQPQIPNTAGKSENKAPKGVSGMGPAPLQALGADPASVVPSQRPQMTPDSVAQAAQSPPQGAAHGAAGGAAPGRPNAPAVYIEQYHAHDDPNGAGQDIARHTVATNAPPRGGSQWQK